MRGPATCKPPDSAHRDLANLLTLSILSSQWRIYSRIQTLPNSLKQVKLSLLRSAMLILLFTSASLCGFTALGADGTPNQRPNQPSNLAPAPWKIVNYWSTTCAPCRIEIPELNLLGEELADSNVEILGVNFDEDDRTTTLRRARRLGIDFPTLTLAEVDALGLPAPSALPTTYILSPTNAVMTKLVGVQTKASIYAVLTELAIPH